MTVPEFGQRPAPAGVRRIYGVSSRFSRFKDYQRDQRAWNREILVGSRIIRRMKSALQRDMTYAAPV